MGKIEARLLKGFRDFLPKEMILRQKVISLIKNIFEGHGFLPLETPALEHFDILSGKYGDQEERLIYKFRDSGDRDVAMRYDLTVPLARVVAQYADLPKPFRRYQIQPVWRADKPQKGRFREFYQCDVDIVGTADITAEVEIISVIYHSLKALGFKNFIIKINHRNLLNGLLTYIGLKQSFFPALCRSIDKMGKVGLGGVREELMQSGFTQEKSNKVVSVLEAGSASSSETLLNIEKLLGSIKDVEKAISDIKNLLIFLPETGVDDKFIRFDVSLARGLDYYTGMVFETVVEEPKIGSITGGGRYDELIGIFSGQKIPAVGTSLGLERIIEVVKEFNLVPVELSVAKALIVNFSAGTLVNSLVVAKVLRDDGIPCEVYPESSKLTKQLKYADRLQIPYVIIPGEDEINKGEVLIKDLQSSAQERVRLENLVNWIVSRLKNRC